MSKKLIFVLLIVFLSSFGLAQAQVVVNEIAWMGTAESANCEWLELYNSSSTEESLDGWVLYEQGGDVKIIDLSGNIQANGYFLIERQTGTCPDAVPGINNISGSFGGSGLVNLPSGEFLILKDADDNIVQSLDFSAGWPAGDNTTKDTMQSVGSSWVTGVSTPGETNEEISPPSSSGGGGGSSTPLPTVNTTPTTKAPEPQKIRTQIVGKNLAFVGQSAGFEGLAFGTAGEKLFNGRYFWNFGDGDSKEVKNNESPKISHTYFYPGDYTVSLEFYLSYYGDTPDATTQVNIKVVSADIAISSVGSGEDFFIELSNSTPYDTDISKWTLSGLNRSFSFPKNTILNAKKKVIFSGKVTGFTLQDKSNLKLLDSQGQIVFDYGASLIPIQVIEPTGQKAANTRRVSVPVSVVEPAEVVLPQEEPIIDNISANVISSDTEEASTENSYIPIITFGALIILSAGAVYFIRQENNSSQPGDDFELLDE